jgi:AbrB family looped-hinge helix DNA binding protein
MRKKDGEMLRGPDGRVFYGSVTVGERGQIVVPAQARRDHGIEPGAKLLVLGSPDGIAIMSADRLLELLGDASSLRDHLTGIDGLGPHER